jgi:hypothetical protein
MAPLPRTSATRRKRAHTTSEAEIALCNVSVSTSFEFSSSCLPPSTSSFCVDIDTPCWLPPSPTSYQAPLALDSNMEALLASLNGGSLSSEPSSTRGPGQEAQLAAMSAWAAYETTTPHYFSAPDNSPDDVYSYAPLSAPAAVASFNFGPVAPAIYVPNHGQGQGSFSSSSMDRAQRYSSMSGGGGGGSDEYDSVYSSSSTTTDQASPATTESALSSPCYGCDTLKPFDPMSEPSCDNAWSPNDQLVYQPYSAWGGNVVQHEHGQQHYQQEQKQQQEQQHSAPFSFPPQSLDDYSFPQ